VCNSFNIKLILKRIMLYLIPTDGLCSALVDSRDFKFVLVGHLFHSGLDSRGGRR
jgi:hypothetical protein